MRKKTHEEFIKEVFEKHEGEYEVLDRYVSYLTPILCKHTTCGFEWKITPSKLLNRKSCPKCNKNLHKDTEYFKNELLEKSNGEFILMSEYASAKEYVKVLHAKCNNEMFASPTYLLNGYKCEHCHERKTYKKTTQKFKDEVNQIYSDEFTICGEYLNATTPITMIHNECGTTFERIPSNILKGKIKCSSPTCKFKNDTRRKTTMQFQREIDEIFNGEYTIESDYISSLTKLKVKHKPCNKTWEVYPTNLLRGHGCLYCYGRYQLNDESFKEKLNIVTNGEYELTGKYTKARNKTLFKHVPCGHIFESTPDNLLNSDKNCPNCSNGMSKGELIIFNFLKNNNVVFFEEKSIEGCRYINHLPFDFAVYKDETLKLLIEYDGKQHYLPVNFGGISDEQALENFKITQLRDKIKNDFCKENNIPLLRIPYWEFENIEYILELELSKFNLLN